MLISLRQIVFTTELLHSASDSDQAVVGSAAAEPVMQDSKDDISQQKGKVSHDDETGDDISMENAHVTNTTSADTDTKTKERKPSKIIFKDYYIDSVCCLLVDYRVKCARHGYRMKYGHKTVQQRTCVICLY